MALKITKPHFLKEEEWGFVLERDRSVILSKDKLRPIVGDK